MITFQDYERAKDKTDWVRKAITNYRSSAE